MGLTSALGAPVGAIPAGTVVAYAGSTAPARWLLCFGQAVSRSDYASLFTAIGTTYGSGNGSTTFTLPDMRGRVAAGKDDMGGTAASRLTSTTITSGAATLGNSGGAQTHTLTEAQMPSHFHTTQITAKAFTTALDGLSGGTTNNNNQNYDSNSKGSNEAHNNVQPTIILNYIIKAVAY